MPIPTKRISRLLMAVLGLGSASLLSSCSIQNDPKATTYIVLSPLAVDRFLHDAADVAKAHDLSPNYGRADPESGRTLHVIEATGGGLVVWVSNTMLSEEECPAYPGMGSDPGQFYMTVRPSMWWPFGRDRALRLSRALSSDLSSKGYRVLTEPAQPCSAMYLNKISRSVPPNKRMQAARANAIWYGHSMLTHVDKVPLLDGSDAREPDASR